MRSFPNFAIEHEIAGADTNMLRHWINEEDACLDLKK